VRERVECERCKAHKDAAVWPGPCLVCGHWGFTPVPPSPGDLAFSDEPDADLRTMDVPPARNAGPWYGPVRRGAW
jgi:hypothetical protein